MPNGNPERMRLKIAATVAGIPLAGGLLSSIYNGIQTWKAIDNIRSARITAQSRNTQDISLLYSSTNLSRDQIIKKQTYENNLSIQANDLVRNMQPLYLGTVPLANNVVYNPYVNLQAAAKAMLLLAEVKAGMAGRNAITQEIINHGLSFQLEGNSAPTGAINVVTIPLAMRAANLVRIQNIDGVTPIEDYPVLSALNDFVKSHLPTIANPDIPVSETAARGVDASIGSITVAASFFVGTYGRRGLFLRAGGATAASIAAFVGAEELGAGRRFLELQNAALENARLQPTDNPLSSDHNYNDYEHINTQYSELVNSPYFQQNIKGNLIVPNKISG